MTEKVYDWSYFKRRIYINNSSVKELFRKWATPGGITEWFIEFATYESKNGVIRKPDEVVQKGDKYVWVFHRGSSVEGEVLDVVEDSLFKFTFGKNDPDSEKDVIVTVTFHEKKEKYGLIFFRIICPIVSSVVFITTLAAIWVGHFISII